MKQKTQPKVQEQNKVKHTEAERYEIHQSKVNLILNMQTMINDGSRKEYKKLFDSFKNKMLGQKNITKDGENELLTYVNEIYLKLSKTLDTMYMELKQTKRKD